MRSFLVLSLLLMITACTGDPGPDSLSSHGTRSGAGGGSCSCHTATLGSRRPIIGAGGDFGGNALVVTHHVAGSADPTASQCLVCHDNSSHMSGIVRLRQADTGTVIPYDPATPSTLEPFCLACHDSNGAIATATNPAAPFSPFADGAAIGTMPYIASRTVASSWNGSSTHRAQGLTCAGTGAAGTGCHGSGGAINMHGSMNSGLLTNRMNFQIPLVSFAAFSADPVGSSFAYDNYKLCFDCHDSSTALTKEVVLGYLQGGAYDVPLVAPTPYFNPAGIQSLFRERYLSDPNDYPPAWGGVNQPYYNDTMFTDGNMALHNFHLIGFRSILYPQINELTWKYRGDPARIGRITCTACHNVHGTEVATIRSTYPELGLESFTGVGADIYTSIYPFITELTVTSPPMNCAVGCHGVAGQTSYWHTPSGE